MIAIVITAIVLSGVIEQEEDLVLSNYPKLFEKDVVIVIGENATQMEYESAEAIAANLENLTGNKPKIYISEKTESLKYTYNLIILGTPNSNEVLKEVCKMANVTMVTDEYPGEGKGILEILKNPWDTGKAMLLVAGSDEWGVKAAASKLEQTYGINETSVIVELEKVEDGYKIFLPSRQFVPSPGISPSTEANITNSSLERVHVLVQFYHIPNATERENLKNAGVKLATYVHNNAWFASISSDSPAKVLQFSFMRWIGEILPEDKISQRIQDGKIGEWAINPDGSVNIVVKLFDDVSVGDANSILRRYSNTFEGPGMLNDWTVTVTSEAIWELANEDGVQWIEEVPPPETTFNDGSRNRVRANIVQAPPYNLDGTNVQVGVWDGGEVDNSSLPHPDLTGRITIIENAPISDHATHVTGTMMGTGSASGGTYRGMAINATAYSYTFLYDDLEPEDHNGAINTYGIDISQNSWGVRTATLLGNYTLRSSKFDNIVHGVYGSEIPIIFAAGNEQDDHPPGWRTITPPGGTAKNTIVVGATYSDTDGMTCFSSWGPVDDGRIKPDIVAPGDEFPCRTGVGNPSINSTIPYGSADHSYPYDEMHGTSMAAPVVSGSAGLMLQEYRNTHDNIDPWPSTIKVLLMHTAVDLGNPGPDYQFGYGRIDVQDAVDTIRDDAACCNVIVENNISADGEMDNYTIEVPAGTTELKVTLVWDDHLGNPAAAKALVNDLDLILTDPNGIRQWPWTLDSSNPANGAERNRRDDLNNVEQVYVSNPIQGTWNITVNGTTVPNPIQNYSLVSSLPMREEDMTDVEWAIEKGLCWLYQNQNPDGSWSNNVGTTSLAALSFVNAGYNETDPTVQKAINYILSKVQGDGSIYSIYNYRTYETSLGLLALVATHNSGYNTTIENAANWLKDSQWDESCLWGSVDKDNWYYGGFGYGRNIRPDLSNTQFALMALDSVLNLSKDDFLWDKAQVFLARDQMRQANVSIPDINYTVAWNPSYNKYDDGGFVYYPGASLSNTGTSYGSMTAAGIWSLRLCNVPTNDPQGRVQAALDWHKGHYTWTQNPGMSPDARRFQYYYYLAFSKALMMTVGNQTFDGHDWYADLSANLTALQHPDGHWVNTYTGHGSEGDPNVVTSYSILALEVRQIPTNIQRLSWLTFILHSNADLHIYDPLGRHVGMNYDTGEIEIQIPNATYSVDPQNITIPELIPGNYRIVLVGTGTGEYTLDVTGGVGADIVSEDSFTSTISEGEVHDANVNVAMITWLTIHVDEPEPTDAMVQSATGTGNVSFVSDSGTIEDLTALNESDLPEENTAIDFPHGLFSFNITGLSDGETVNVTINFPQDIPTTTEYWKYHTPEGWYQIPMGSNDGDHIITIQLTDGGIGDDDGIANGVIVDQGGPGVSAMIAASIIIEPETLNLASQGVFTAFIQLIEDYNVTYINVSTVECEGAPAVRGMVSEEDNTTYIAKFNRQELVNVTTGDAVELTVTGNLYDGTPFEGNDTIRVIDKGKGK